MTKQPLGPAENEDGWFPLPSTSAQVFVIAKPGELFSEEEEASLRTSLFAGLRAPDGVLWRDKVGVLSPHDGSGKASTRLLYTDGQVWKTDLHLFTRSLEEADLWVRNKHALAMQLDIWHPDKRWFVIQCERGFLPVSVCPFLRTLRQLPDEQQVALWSEALAWGLSLAEEEGYSFDLGPSNFGLAPSRGRLFYIDDEVYTHFTMRDLAEAIVMRVPECGVLDWNQYGAAVGRHLRPKLSSEQVESLLTGIEEFPLVPRFVEARAKLLEGLSQLVTPQASVSSSLPQRVCVFSDIHGNHVALQAVLSEAKKLGAEHFLCLGDVVGYGPSPGDCISMLQGLEALTMLRGNHDQMVGTGEPEDGCNRLAKASTYWTVKALDDAQRRWLLTLPLDVYGDDWLAVHGSPHDPRRLYGYIYELNYKDNLAVLEREGLRLCFFGHTHVQYVYGIAADGSEFRQDSGTIALDEVRHVLVNPGSVGQPRDRQTSAAFVMWDRKANTLTFHRVEYALDEVIEAVQKTTLPPEMAERLEAGW